MFSKFIEGNACYRIRLWLNERSMAFYDCECGSRRPVQDLARIRKHLLTHGTQKPSCTVCMQSFDTFALLESHVKQEHEDVALS
jgi:hypothetical protein